MQKCEVTTESILKEALLYEKLESGSVRCRLCSHRCLIEEQKSGVCLVRKNVGGTLYSLIYGRVIASHADPIEKKPLYHYLPGSVSHSIATVGCNLRCTWCQNWEISQMPAERGVVAGKMESPEQVVRKAIEAGSQSIAYTYTEPTVFLEYALDVARLAREAGLRNVFVTNGYMTPEALNLIEPYLDAANVDLKAFAEETYRRYAGASLEPVLESLKRMKGMGVWVEVTTLLVPGINDDLDELRRAVEFVVRELGPEIPWHISRYHPAYRMSKSEATPRSTLEKAAAIGSEFGLRYVYLGNVAGETNTLCHKCGELLIRRKGFWVSENRVSTGSVCPACGTEVAGIGMAPS